MSEKNLKGTLEIICGSMFSGKSEELIRRIRRLEIAKRKIMVFKHSLDDRTLVEYITSHNGEKLKAFAVDHAQSIQELTLPEVEVVAIDEVQFFNPEIIKVIFDLVENGKRVMVAGLDLDFRGVPFGPMPTLMAMADSITKLNAICMQCGKDAHYTQRLVNGKPAKYNDPLIVVGAQDKYQARCRDCYMIDQVPLMYKHEQK